MEELSVCCTIESSLGLPLGTMLTSEAVFCVDGSLRERSDHPKEKGEYSRGKHIEQM